MTHERHGGRPRRDTIHKKYRRLLRRPALSVEHIQSIRKHIILLAQTICEHVWGKKFY